MAWWWATLVVTMTPSDGHAVASAWLGGVSDPNITIPNNYLDRWVMNGCEWLHSTQCNSHFRVMQSEVASTSTAPPATHRGWIVKGEKMSRWCDNDGGLLLSAVVHRLL